MSRWSRRSDAEKVRIYNETLKKRPYKSRYKPEERKVIQQLDASRAMDVYNNKEIPVLCLKHGWQGSDRYLLTKEYNPVIQREAFMLYGHCRVCGKANKRVWPPLGLEEAVVGQAALMLLSKEGRVRDGTQPKKEEKKEKKGKYADGSVNRGL